MELLMLECHMYTNRTAHSILFMLKALDLDLRLKKPFGTVYGYGREKVYAGFQTRLNGEEARHDAGEDHRHRLNSR